jgi:hypothetical protein
MRETKYRGKQEQSKEWAYGNLVQYINTNEDDNEDYILTQEEVHHTLDLGGRIECDMEPVLSNTVGQYVPVIDAYEGDVLYGTDTDEYGTVQSSWYGFVKYNEEHDRIMIMDDLGDWYETDDFNFDKVVGNIYDNPKLISYSK